MQSYKQQSDEKKTDSQKNNILPNTINIDEEIQQLQQSQLQNLNHMNNNNNNNNNSNMYINNNPTLRGYRPKNGNHIDRSHMLSKPGSFVSGNMANDVNEYEKRMPIPFDRGGDYDGRNGNYDGRDEEWQYGRKFDDCHENNDYNQDHIDDMRHPDRSYGYNPHTRMYHRSRHSRFDPIQNSHNQNLNYGFNEMN